MCPEWNVTYVPERALGRDLHPGLEKTAAVVRALRLLAMGENQTLVQTRQRSVLLAYTRSRVRLRPSW
jgi:hypothetical protein